MTKKRKIIVSIIGSVIALILIIFGTIRLHTPSAAATEGYALYQVEETDPLVFSGVVEPENTKTIYLDPTLGEITEIHVENGQSVEEGDTLLTYANDSIKDELTTAKRNRDRIASNISNTKEDIDLATERKSNAEQQLSNAKTELNSLSSDDINYQVEKSALEQEIAQYEASIQSEEEVIRTLERTLQELEADSADNDANIASLEKNETTKVTADTEGIVRLQEKGKTDATIPLIQILSKSVIVVGEVSEHDYHALSIDQEVIVKPISNDKEIKGSITFIDKLASSALEGSGAMTYRFDVAIDRFIQYGFSVQIVLPTEKLVVPESAVLENEEGEFVFVYEAGEAIKRSIVTTKENGLLVVSEGLEQGEQIIENPDEELESGQEVTVIE